MAYTLGKEAYEQLVREDIAWLEQQPRTLERQHILAVLHASVDLLYTPEGEYRFEKLSGA